MVVQALFQLDVVLLVDVGAVLGLNVFSASSYAPSALLAEKHADCVLT